MQAAEELVRAAVQWLRLGVETAGAVIVCLGVLLALFQFARALFTRQAAEFHGIRLILSRYLALALEFQLGADILSTAVAPDWSQIGKLAAIAVIRTGLNYFLSREMREERAAELRSADDPRPSTSRPAA
jgi:uncharacterized membrane protein